MKQKKYNTITQASIVELLKQSGGKGMSSRELTQAGYFRRVSASLPIYTEKIRGKERWFYADYDNMYKKTSKVYLVIPCSSGEKVLKFYSLEVIALFLNASVEEVKESFENGTELNGYCIDEVI